MSVTEVVAEREGGGRRPSGPGDDATEREPQGDDEIGRPSLHDAEGQMCHPSALDHPRALQVDRPGAEVVEQSDAAPEQDGHQIDVDLIQESRSDALLHDACGAHADVLVASDRLRLLEGALEAVGDERERRSFIHPLLWDRTAHNKDRYIQRVVAACSRGWPSRFNSCSPLIHQVYPFPGGNALSSHRGHTCSPVGEDARTWHSTHVLPSNCFGIGAAYGVFGSVHSSGLFPTVRAAAAPWHVDAEGMAMYPGTASGQLAWTTPITAGRLAKSGRTLQ